MQSLPPAALGAIIAAIITSLLSFIGLVISKEQKTSEFRQAWIDGLRADVAELVGHTWVMYWNYQKLGPAKHWEKSRDSALAHENLVRRVRLRLNLGEDDSRRLWADIERLQHVLSDWNGTTFEQMDAIDRSIQENAAKIMKSEWERVKRGEPFFQFASGALTVIFVASAIFGFILLMRATTDYGAKEAGPASVSVTYEVKPSP